MPTEPTHAPSVILENLATETDDELHICIGLTTIRRPNDEDYLMRTVKAIRRELDQYVFSKHISAVIMHTRSTEHTWFDKAKEEFKNDKTFDFVEQDRYNKTIWERGKVQGRAREMRPEDLQQNIDSSAMIGYVYDTFCKRRPKGYLMIMEDDFEMCPYSFEHLHRVIHAAENLYFPNFSGLRVSYGFNGIILHCHDLKFISEMLFNDMILGPPDDMLGHFIVKTVPAGQNYFGPSRQYGIYRHNILHHIGTVSVVFYNYKPERITPACYDSMSFGGLGHQERYNYPLCGDKEFYPCTHPNMGNTILSIRSTAEFDNKYRMDEGVMDTMKIVQGELGESCDTVCKKIDMKCTLALFPTINSCPVLKQYFNCDECIPHLFWEYVAAGRSPMYIPQRKICFFSQIMSENRCDGEHKDMVRLCPCGKLKKTKK